MTRSFDSMELDIIWQLAKAFASRREILLALYFTLLSESHCCADNASNWTIFSPILFEILDLYEANYEFKSNFPD